MPTRSYPKPRRKKVAGFRPRPGAKSDAPGERLQRILADAGVASRRACEAMIEEGRVSVNGKIVSTLPAFADARTDRIVVDGQPISRPERRVYLMLNKPARTLSTSRDEPGAGRKTVVELVDHPAAPRLFPVGRLDFQTTGLVLLTNDGDLANRLTHPRYGVPRTYHAVVKGDVTPEMLTEIGKGLGRFERKTAKARPGTPAPRVELSIAKREPGRTILSVTLVRGPVQALAGLLKTYGCAVRSFERIALGPLTLRGVGRGQWRELDRKEIGELRRAARASTGSAGATSPGPKSAAVKAGGAKA